VKIDPFDTGEVAWEHSACEQVQCLPWGFLGLENWKGRDEKSEIAAHEAARYYLMVYGCLDPAGLEMGRQYPGQGQTHLQLQAYSRSLD
jgi:hypothetical protein